MALIKPTIKWPKENYSLGSYYAKLTPSMRQQVDAALNNIDPETYPGRVLEGHLVFNEGHKRTCESWGLITWAFVYRTSSSVHVG